MPHNSQTKKDKHANQAKEIERLEARVKRLQLAIAAKDAVLSQFADNGNWDAQTTSQWVDRVQRIITCYVWDAEGNPVELANQALGEGK